MVNYVRQFFRQNQGSFPHALSMKRSLIPIQFFFFFFFFAFLTQVIDCSKNFYRLENFLANVLNAAIKHSRLPWRNNFTHRSHVNSPISGKNNKKW